MRLAEVIRNNAVFMEGHGGGIEEERFNALEQAILTWHKETILELLGDDCHVMSELTRGVDVLAARELIRRGRNQLRTEIKERIK